MKPTIKPELRENLAYMSLISALKGDVDKSEQLRRVVRRIDEWRATASAGSASSHACA